MRSSSAVAVSPGLDVGKLKNIESVGYFFMELNINSWYLINEMINDKIFSKKYEEKLYNKDKWLDQKTKS